ncbi:MAG: MlaD family protein, partial [Terrimicrobiaceae bacterium]
PVRISFRNGHGIQAGQTQIRYLGLPIGYVETATLNAAEQSVDTVVRFQPEYDHLRTAGAVFSLIRPHISLEGVSGLEALAGGPFIDCRPGTGGELADTFEGRALSDDGWQTVQSVKEGLSITLQAKNLPAMGKGTPVLYRGLVAGRVEDRTINADGTPGLAVTIRKEFAQTLPRNARFWQVPALSVQAGPGVLNMDVAGLQSLVQGALAYDVFSAAEAPAAAGAKFELLPTEAAARATSPPIRITFENGQGLLAGRTEVRYLGQPVGLVESVSSKSGKVEAIIRLNDGYEFLRREGSAFAVMRLNVSLNGISGLETVVSGVYIECVPATNGPLRDRFTAVTPAKAAFEQTEQRGFEVVITTARSTIAVDAPVTYRGVVVGKVLRKVLANDGRDVGLCLVIDRPYASLIRDNTKFWDASGMKISLGFFNLRVQNASLETLARGGIAFATPDTPGQRVRPGHEFPLNPAPRREWLRWSPAVPTAE